MSESQMEDEIMNHACMNYEKPLESKWGKGSETTSTTIPAPASYCVPEKGFLDTLWPSPGEAGFHIWVLEFKKANCDKVRTFSIFLFVHCLPSVASIQGHTPSALSFPFCISSSNFC